MFCKFEGQISTESKIIDFTVQNSTEQLNMLERLVNINSETANVEGVKKVGEIIKSELENLGFNAQWHHLPAEMEHAGSLVATRNGSSKQRILLIGHLDTVFPMNGTFQKLRFSSDKKYAIGPGVIDDKGGIVTILYAMKALDHINLLKDLNITIVLTGDEELVARPTSVSRRVLIDAAKNSDIALGFEFALSADRLVVGRRGLSEWFLTSTGKSQHSSLIFQPDIGFGAIYEISRVLNSVQQQLSGIHGLTINPGIILGGQNVKENIQNGSGSAFGKKTIVSALASVHGDMRFLDEQQQKKAQKVMNEITAHALSGTNSSLIFKPIIPPMVATRSNYELLSQYSRISQKLGGPILKEVSPQLRGGADISYITPYVKAALDGLGPWGSGAHTENETLEIEALRTVTQRAALFIANYGIRSCKTD